MHKIYCEPIYDARSTVYKKLQRHAHNVQTHAHTHTYQFNGPFSRTTRVRRYQKGKTNQDFTESRDSEWLRHQLGHMQVCTLLQTAQFFTGRMPFLPPNQQRQSTEGLCTHAHNTDNVKLKLQTIMNDTLSSAASYSTKLPSFVIYKLYDKNQTDLCSTAIMIRFLPNALNVNVKKFKYCLQCFDAAGWVAGRASGL